MSVTQWGLMIAFPSVILAVGVFLAFGGAPGRVKGRHRR